MKWLTVKNWAEFQHYADRNPTWIKLHRSLLDDYDFCALQDHAKAHLMLIWLFASQSGGRVPADSQFLTKKLGLIRAVDLDQLVSAGFLIPEHDASEPLADGYQAASLEKRREQKPKSKRRALPDDFGISDAVRAWAKAEGHDHIDASLAYFRDYVQANGKLYADWDAALRNCIKGDWGKARENARKPRAPTALVPRPSFKHKCIRCETPCDGIEWKGNKYCAKCYGELSANERGADMKKLLESRAA